MAGSRLEATDLIYDPHHRVLICRSCSYAVQPNALDSHLLRHKVYRADRRRLLANVVNLDLPADVPTPLPGLPPVDHLPVLSGYRCAAPACNHLTVSSKRMKRHWSEAHGSSGDPVPDLSSIARAVALQTFFRGTKTRYFEVSADCARPRNTNECENDIDDERTDALPSTIDPSSTVQEESAAAHLMPHVSNKSNSRDKSNDLVAVDLNALHYFHHFATATSATTPSFSTQQCGQQLAQTPIIARALQHHWLASGVLALSAYHMAFQAEDSLSCSMHRARASHLYSAFSAGNDRPEEHLPSCSTNSNLGRPDETNSTAAHIGSLLICARRVVEGRANPAQSEPYTSCSLETIVSSIRDCVITKYSPGVNADSTPWLNNQGGNSMPRAESPPAALLSHLRVLHLRIADAVGKPACNEDVYATIAAIAALAESCETSFAHATPACAWAGIATWLAKLPAHFYAMMAQHHPAALVVLAHWAAVLVGRAEAVGCWVLQGASKAVVDCVRRRLSGDGHVAVDLLEGLTPSAG